MAKKAHGARESAPTAIQPQLGSPGSDLAETIAAGLTLVLVYAVLLSRFDLKLLFTDTILTGGDTASWYQVLHTLKTDFLPHGRLFGFSQSNFFGYLEGQHYFVLPFLSAALLGYFMPLTVALKLATVAGGFALPLTMFIAAASITGRKRAGAIASALSLLFLFNESYTIFGGNWLSTFAGEFSFSWGIALLPLLVASVFQDFSGGARKEGAAPRGRSRGIRSGFLLGLIGLCHFFVFMPAFFLPFFAAFGLAPRLFKKPRGKANRKRASSDANAESSSPTAPETTLRILVTYVTAFLTMAFWLLPMATTRAWAQPISMIWRFASLKDFARQTQAWIWAPLAAVFLAIACARRAGRELRSFMAFALYALAACAFLFYAAPGLGMPDIRFIPTVLLVCALGLAVIMERLLARLGMREPGGKAAERKAGPFALDAALPSAAGFLLTAVLCAAVPFMARNAPSWFRWNYSGYEARTEWPALQEMGERYRGTTDDGRFLWEKQDQRDNKDFGSERGFENLSLFTGHPTSEGIHYGSSMMARAATYLQSSYSQNPVDPEAERIYSIVDPASWPGRFSLLNTRYIVTHSEKITGLFAASADFSLDAKIGKFSVFSYEGYPGHYVQAMPADAISIVDEGAGGFKSDYYRFFREYELYPYPFVAGKFADAKLRALAKGSGGLWRNYDEYRGVYLAKAALAGAAGAAAPAAAQKPAAAASAVSNEHVDNFRISFDTSAPGTPHYIKVSYAPGWKSRGGERIYPAAPGFMLVIPAAGRVELEYGRTPWEILGIVLTLLALPFALFFRRVRPGKDFPWKLLIGAAYAVFAAAAVFLVLQTSAGYPALAKDIEAARRLDLSAKDQRARALALVEPWATMDNLERFDNRLVFDAYRIKALALLRENKGKEAKASADILRARYPHTRVLESLPALAP